VDGLPVDDAVRAGKVDELENAHGFPGAFREPQRAQALFVDDHHLAGRDVPHQLGAGGVERARLGGHEPRIAGAADR